MREPIIVWEYYKAPEELRISENGGDEDWLAEIPPCFANGLEVGRNLGLREDSAWDSVRDSLWDSAWGSVRAGEPTGVHVDEYDHPTKSGWKIMVGCHA